MPRKLPFNVYAKDGALLASLAGLEDAARLMSKGRIVRWGARGRVLWSEGFEGFCAGESFDKAARIMFDRVMETDVKLSIDEIRKGYGLTG